MNQLNKKILIVTGLYPPEIGGPATYTKLLEEELPKYGYQVSVLAFSTVRHLPKIIRHLVFGWKIFKLARRVDIIFAQDAVSVGLPTFLATKLIGKSFYLRMPGDYAWEQAVQRFGVTDSIDEFQVKKYQWQVELLRWLEHLVAKQAKYVIAPSHYFRNLVTSWGVVPERSLAIYNGIKLRNSSTSQIDWNLRSKTIVSAGRLVPWKGFLKLIDLIPKVGSDWELVIVGDGPERGKLEDKIIVDNLSSRVKLVGVLPPDDLHNLLLKSRIFVLNTSFESFSFQVVEAMNTGIPVITTNIGNLSEIISDNQNGILVEPDDLSAIASAIQKLEEDKIWREQVISSAISKAKVFSIDNTLKTLDKLWSGGTI